MANVVRTTHFPMASLLSVTQMMQNTIAVQSGDFVVLPMNTATAMSVLITKKAQQQLQQSQQQ